MTDNIRRAFEVDFNMTHPLARVDLDDIPEIGSEVIAVCMEDRDHGFGCIAKVTDVLMPENMHYRDGELLVDYALITLDEGRWS